MQKEPSNMGFVVLISIVATIFFVLRFVRETKGRELEEMER